MATTADSTPMPPDPRTGASPEVRGAEGRVYFPGLDGLRAVAIALVFFFHDRQMDLLDQIAQWASVPVAMLIDPVLRLLGFDDVSYRVRRFVSPLRDDGWIGVQIFFVLSGFLIGTLLLNERERFGRVDLRAFWMRRALRIWPLYYLVVLIGFGLVLPIRAMVGAEGMDLRPLITTRLPAFLVFLGNWSLVIDGMIPMDTISVLWSVCVEEQFYLFVPLLIAWIGPRTRVAVVVLLMAVAVVGRYEMARAGVEGISLRVNTLANLDTLLAGVLLAMASRRWPGIIAGSAWRWPWRLAVIGLGYAVFSVELAHGGDPWRAATTDILIWAWGVSLVAWAASDRDRWAGVLRTRTMVWLGRISYGLYLYHEIALGISSWAYVSSPYFPEMDLVFALMGPALTIGLASASYYGFERPFLRLKRRWTRVPSRPWDGLEAGPAFEALPEAGTMTQAPGEPGRPRSERPPTSKLP